MKLTRRDALAGAAATALGAGGLYELVDRLAASPERAAAAGFPPEQHVLHGVRTVTESGVEVLVPPLHHQVVTANVRAGDLRAAQRELEDALTELERRYEPTPAGLGISLGWGLSYFRRHVAWDHYLADRFSLRTLQKYRPDGLQSLSQSLSATT